MENKAHDHADRGHVNKEEAEALLRVVDAANDNAPTKKDPAWLLPAFSIGWGISVGLIVYGATWLMLAGVAAMTVFTVSYLAANSRRSSTRANPRQDPFAEDPALRGSWIYLAFPIVVFALKDVFPDRNLFASALAAIVATGFSWYWLRYQMEHYRK